MAHLFGRNIALANKRLRPLFSLSPLGLATLLAIRLDKWSSAAALAAARKLITQHLDLGFQRTKSFLEQGVLCYQFSASSSIHTYYFDIISMRTCTLSVNTRTFFRFS